MLMMTMMMMIIINKSNNRCTENRQWVFYSKVKQEKWSIFLFYKALVSGTDKLWPCDSMYSKSSSYAQRVCGLIWNKLRTFASWHKYGGCGLLSYQARWIFQKTFAIEKSKTFKHTSCCALWVWPGAPPHSYNSVLICSSLLPTIIILLLSSDYLFFTFYTHNTV